jgi:hypothetical protein
MLGGQKVFSKVSFGEHGEIVGTGTGHTRQWFARRPSHSPFLPYPSGYREVDTDRYTLLVMERGLTFDSATLDLEDGDVLTVCVCCCYTLPPRVATDRWTLTCRSMRLASAVAVSTGRPWCRRSRGSPTPLPQPLSPRGRPSSAELFDARPVRELLTPRPNSNEP